jgi:hypothetical protein
VVGRSLSRPPTEPYGDVVGRECGAAQSPPPTLSSMRVPRSRVVWQCGQCRGAQQGESWRADSAIPVQRFLVARPHPRHLLCSCCQTASSPSRDGGMGGRQPPGGARARPHRGALGSVVGFWVAALLGMQSAEAVGDTLPLAVRRSLVEAKDCPSSATAQGAAPR